MCGKGAGDRLTTIYFTFRILYVQKHYVSGCYQLKEAIANKGIMTVRYFMLHSHTHIVYSHSTIPDYGILHEPYRKLNITPSKSAQKT